MSLIPQETLEQVAAANDIVEVISGYFPLKRAGANYRALCPFHQEKTPSFNVNPQRQIYHCFGCQASGAVFQFVMAYENIDFPTAVRKLADRAGIKVVTEEPSPDQERRHYLKGRLLALHAEAADWFHRNLLKAPAAQAARGYLKGRGISSAVAQSWKLGYAPDAWDAFITWAEGRGYTPEEMLASGIARQQEPPREGIFDRFRNRVLFPICNDYGEVIAFSGRLLEADAKAVKYLNSPETLLFNKGSVLFGLHRSKRALIDKNSAIVLEGQIDLITAFEAGVQNVIASQGTAFTETQVRVLRRFADEVVLCFDADSAGEKATNRSVGALLEMNFFVRVAAMPPGQDPDSLIRSQGADAFSELIKGARDFFEFQLDQLNASPSMNVREKIEAARKMAAFVSPIGDPLLRETVASRVTARLGLSRDDFQKTLAAAKRKPEEVSPLIERPRPAIWMLCILAFRDKGSRDWLLGRNWSEVLEGDADGRLLKTILGADLDPESPASVSAFLAGLDAGDETLFSAMLVEKVPSKAGVAQDYWAPLEVAELRRRELFAQQQLANGINGGPEADVERLHLELLRAQFRTVEAEQKTPGLRQEQQAALASKARQIVSLQIAALQRQSGQSGDPNSIQKEVLDLQRTLNDIARPLTSDS